MIVVFKKRGGIFDKLIEWWTGGPYCHCELMWGDRTMFSSNAAEHGTRFLTPRNLLDSEWDCLWIPTSKDIAAAISKSCAEEDGMGYDWRGLFVAQVLHLRWRDDKKWFCSEVCSWALMENGVIPKSPPAAYNPNNFARALLRKFGARQLTFALAVEYENKAA
jgi:hypothetical protein